MLFEYEGSLKKNNIFVIKFRQLRELWIIGK